MATSDKDRGCVPHACLTKVALPLGRVCRQCPNTARPHHQRGERLGSQSDTGFSECRLCGSFSDAQLEHVRTPFGRICMGAKIRRSTRRRRLGESSRMGMHVCTSRKKKGLCLSVYVDDIKVASKQHNMKSMLISKTNSTTGSWDAHNESVKPTHALRNANNTCLEHSYRRAQATRPIVTRK